MGIPIFPSVSEAIRAGYAQESPGPDAVGFLRVRIPTAAGWARALARPGRENADVRR